jgi:cobalt/nickel transport system permease protein
MKREKTNPSPTMRGGIKKDVFLDKSIVSMLALLQAMRATDRPTKSFIAGLPINVFYKVCCTLSLIVFVVLSRSSFFLLSAITYLILAIAAMPMASMKRILAGSGAAFLISGLMVAPAVIMGSAGSSSAIPVKAFASAAAVGVLAQTSKFTELTGALRRLKIPDFFVMILDMCLKCMVMLGEHSLEMLRALKLRRLGGRGEGYSSLSGVGGTVFLKSREMAEEMHQAMVCRGFEGVYRPNRKLSFSWADAAYLGINLGLAALFFIAG